MSKTKLPKLPLSRYYFVIKINSEKEFKHIFNICSGWLKNEQDKFFGFHCLNYGKNDPRLTNTMFFIWTLRNKKAKAKNFTILKDWLESKGFIYINDSDRNIDTVVTLLKNQPGPNVS